MKAAFSAWVWNLPCPNLEVVSINLRLTTSMALFLVWVRRDFLRVRALFLGPMQHPCENYFVNFELAREDKEYFVSLNHGIFSEINSREFRITK